MLCGLFAKLKSEAGLTAENLGLRAAPWSLFSGLHPRIRAFLGGRLTGSHENGWIGDGDRASLDDAQTRLNLDIYGRNARRRRWARARTLGDKTKLERAGRSLLLRLIGEHGFDGAARVLRALADEIEAKERGTSN